MRLFLSILTICCVLALFLFESAVIVAPAKATNLPAPTFSAGDWITQGGQTVGCKCPKLKGPCVCEYTEPQN